MIQRCEAMQTPLAPEIGTRLTFCVQISRMAPPFFDPFIKKISLREGMGNIKG